MNTSRIDILVADDEELVRNLFAEIVRNDGYHVLIANDGIEPSTSSRQAPVVIHGPRS